MTRIWIPLTILSAAALNGCMTTPSAHDLRLSSTDRKAVEMKFDPDAETMVDRYTREVLLTLDEESTDQPFDG